MGSTDLTTACEFLKKGKLIAYPTEAVWGFGCDPYNKKSVLKILEIKKRPIEKGLILLAADVQQISELLVNLSGSQINLLRETWPGPTTWLIPDTKKLFPRWLKGDYESIAIRVSAHPLLKDLTYQYGKPIVSTSANKSGEAEVKTRLTLEEQFADKIDYILEGELGGRSSPSQIRDIVTGAVLR